MHSSPSILSTKKLSVSQQELLLNAGVRVVTYDAIKISYIDVELPQKVSKAIFTSQNGVASVFKNPMEIEDCFCVGDKTTRLLEKKNQNVVKTAKNSVELARFIIENHKNDTFHYFCGSQRREELPSMLQENRVSFAEIETYKTALQPKRFEQHWDGILFFSPSAVQSYFAENNVNYTTAICIGETTAYEARKHSANVVVANSMNIESVIAKAVKMLRA